MLIRFNDTDNAIFKDGNRECEVIRILTEIAKCVSEGHKTGNISDINGNSVGSWAMKEKKSAQKW